MRGGGLELGADRTADAVPGRGGPESFGLSQPSSTAGRRDSAGGTAVMATSQATNGESTETQGYARRAGALGYARGDDYGRYGNLDHGVIVGRPGEHEHRHVGRARHRAACRPTSGSRAGGAWPAPLAFVPETGIARDATGLVHADAEPGHADARARSGAEGRDRRPCHAARQSAPRELAGGRPSPVLTGPSSTPGYGP